MSLTYAHVYYIDGLCCMGVGVGVGVCACVRMFVCVSVNCVLGGYQVQGGLCQCNLCCSDHDVIENSHDERSERLFF
jgi:hypothetical protein